MFFTILFLLTIIPQDKLHLCDMVVISTLADCVFVLLDIYFPVVKIIDDSQRAKKPTNQN